MSDTQPSDMQEITVRTRKPDKWLFVDTNTGQVWRWRHGKFELHGRAVDEVIAQDTPPLWLDENLCPNCRTYHEGACDPELERRKKPKGQEYCDTPGTSCSYEGGETCVNCGRPKGWRRK